MDSNALRFSFALYENHDKYCLSRFSPEDIKATLIWLKELCQLNFDDLKLDLRKYKFYAIDWSRTNEPQGFADPKLADTEVYELLLDKVNNRAARVFGVVSDNTFYIVWFDYNHEVTKAYRPS